jgi:hypothetical protein
MISTNNIFRPYHPDHYRYRRVDRSARIKSTDAVFNFIQEVKDSDIVIPDNVLLEDYRIRTVHEADWILNSMNTPHTFYSSLLSIQCIHQSWQCFDYLYSNLGRGFVFFFVCNGCRRRTLHLYMPDGLFTYLCRHCHKLSYPTKQQIITDLRHIEMRKTNDKSLC